jgi:hypothetical protein
MTDITPDQLAALSEAAQEEWSPRNNFAPSPLVSRTRWEYLITLERLHRANQIVLIGPDAVENVGFAIWHKLGQIESNVRAGQLTKNEVREIAIDALAALGVK